MCGDEGGDEEEEEELFYVDETGAYVFTIFPAHVPCSCPHMWVHMMPGDDLHQISSWPIQNNIPTLADSLADLTFEL